MNKHIWLSYILNENTPGYGGNLDFKFETIRSIAKGDTSNNSRISLAMHTGTHMDFPLHFFQDGQPLQHFEISNFTYENAAVIELSSPNKLITDSDIQDLIKKISSECDCLLLKTGWGQHRGQKRYWENGYGIHKSVASMLRQHLPKLKTIGFDFISLTSYQHREEGRESHKEFLNPKNPILLIEDMDLSQINQSTKFEYIIASPLMVENADGAPVTVMGKII